MASAAILLIFDEAQILTSPALNLFRPEHWCSFLCARWFFLAIEDLVPANSAACSEKVEPTPSKE